MSRTKKNGNGKKSLPVTAQEAVSILQSAIGYCQQAGIAVQAHNGLDGVTLTLPGVFYTVTAKREGAAAEFHIGTPPTNNGSPEAAISAQS
jgi:hypothetical protein